MNSEKNVEALFGTPLNTTVVGSGSILKTPDLPAFPPGMNIILTAKPGTNAFFGAWGSAAQGKQNPLSFTMTGTNPTVSAIFAALPANQTTLTLLADAGGSVFATPCTNEYQLGATVSLLASPTPGQTFLGWSGDASGTANPLSIVLDRSKTIRAHFSHATWLSLGLEPSQFGLQGVPGDSYELQSSTNLIQSETLFVMTNYYSSFGFVDPETNPAPFRVYRAVVH